MEDMNEKIDKVLEEARQVMYDVNSRTNDTSKHITIHQALTIDQGQEINTYYVAASRAKHKLTNARHLNNGEDIE